MSELSRTGLVYVGGELHQLLVPAGAVAQAVVEECDGRAAGHHYTVHTAGIFWSKTIISLDTINSLSYIVYFSHTHDVRQ